MNFRLIVLGFAIILLCQGGPFATAGAQDDSVLRVIATPIEGSAGVQYAQVLGIFKKYGLTVEVRQLNSGEAAAAAIVGGPADIGIGNLLSLAIAHQKGIPLKLIAPGALYIDKAPTNALVVAQQSSFRTPKDLENSTIGVPAISDVDTIATKAWFDNNGVDSSTIKFVELKTPQMGTVIANHTVAAAFIGSPAVYVALDSGCCRVLGRPYDVVASRFMVNGWYARNDWVAAHLDAAKRFARAITEAQLWANKNRSASGKILLSYAKIDPQLLETMTRETFAGRFEPALVQPLINLALHYKLLTAYFSATELYNSLM
jgi:NitT/TauT family transport system substrate-binding protein